MKNYLFLTLTLMFSLQVSAQRNEEHQEHIKALKTAYITKGLHLSSEDAQKFWPIYNEYEDKRRQLFRREHRDIGDLNCVSETEAADMLKEYVEIEKKDYLLQKKFFTDLESIFSAKEILQLKKVEDEFNKKLFREYRERHSKKDNS